jgi:hypothetical protein
MPLWLIPQTHPEAFQLQHLALYLPASVHHAEYRQPFRISPLSASKSLIYSKVFSYAFRCLNPFFQLVIVYENIDPLWVEL